MSGNDDAWQAAHQTNIPIKRHLDEHSVPEADSKRYRLEHDDAEAAEDGAATADGDEDMDEASRISTAARVMQYVSAKHPKWDETKVNQPVDRREFRRVGPYVLGPRLGNSPVDSIVQYLAKKEGTDKFVLLKILTLGDEKTSTVESRLQEKQGKMLLHTELSLLSILADQPGVIRTHGLLMDSAYEEERIDDASPESRYTGRICKRLILVLDCLWPHEFCPRSQANVNLQQHLIKVKKIEDRAALALFCDIVAVVEQFHERNIIHRDLKLGNIVVNRYTNRIYITNFCLGRYLQMDNDTMLDQRGSPAYISPEVLTGRPYLGKPIDVWSLGVMLYMMVFGQFPFYEASPSLLFKKIKAADYTFPITLDVSYETIDLIRGMLVLNPTQRLTASGVRERIETILLSRRKVKTTEQAVPVLTADKITNTSTPSRKAKTYVTKQPDTPEQVVPLHVTTTTSAASATTPGTSSAEPSTTTGAGRCKNKKPFMRPSADIFVPNQQQLFPTLPPLRTRSSMPDMRYHIPPLTPQLYGQHTFDLGYQPSLGGRLSAIANAVASVSGPISMPPHFEQSRSIFRPFNHYFQHPPLPGGLIQPPVVPPPSPQPVAAAAEEPSVAAAVVAAVAPAAAAAAAAPLPPPPPQPSLSEAFNQLYENAELLLRRRGGFRATPAQRAPDAAAADESVAPNYPRRVSVVVRRQIRRGGGRGGGNSGDRSVDGSNGSSIDSSRFLVPTLYDAAAPTASSQLERHDITMWSPNRFRRTVRRMRPTAAAVPTVPTVPPVAAAAAAAVYDRPDSIQSLFNTFNEMFIRGRLPPASGNLVNFDGCLTPEFSDKVVRWLMSEYGDHAIVDQLFQGSTDNSLQKVRALLQRSGVQMFVENGVFKLRRDQALSLLLILTYVMQATGYNMSYFWA